MKNNNVVISLKTILKNSHNNDLYNTKKQFKDVITDSVLNDLN